MRRKPIMRVGDRPDLRALTADGEIDRLRADNDRLRGAILGFAKSHEWAGDAWTRLPTVKALFDIAQEGRG